MIGTVDEAKARLNKILHANREQRDYSESWTSHMCKMNISLIYETGTAVPRVRTSTKLMEQVFVPDDVDDATSATGPDRVVGSESVELY